MTQEFDTKERLFSAEGVARIVNSVIEIPEIYEGGYYKATISMDDGSKLLLINQDFESGDEDHVVIDLAEYIHKTKDELLHELCKKLHNDPNLHWNSCDDRGDFMIFSGEVWCPGEMNAEVLQQFDLHRAIIYKWDEESWSWRKWIPELTITGRFED